MDNEKFLLLLEKYVKGSINITEHDELFEMLASGKYQHLIDMHIEKDIQDKSNWQELPLPPHISQEVVHNIFAAQPSLKALPQRTSRWLRPWLAAASVLLCVLAGVFYFSSREVDNQTSSSVFNNEKLEHFSNETNKPTLLKLSDGSTVLLQPTATLQYPKEFGTGKREVLLQGDGFFDIARNDQKPFYVYCNNIITKVLGTSFNVGVNKTTGDVEVSVKKGKVQVYTQDEKGETSRMSAVILTPNHKAIYNRSKNVLQATVSDHPLPIAAQNNREKPANAKPILVFEQEKMAVVLKHLQEYFGIQMAVENETFNNCLFSGDLSEGDLYDQLHIIRLTMKAEFEVNGTTILIKGSGCSD